MGTERYQIEVDLTKCETLVDATATTWEWIYDNLDMLDDDDRREVLNHVTDMFLDKYPDKCPNLESDQQAAIETGIRQAEDSIQLQLSEIQQYTPAQWMSDAMDNADFTLNRPPQD